MEKKKQNSHCKLSLFADDMILYTENPKDSTRKLLELINEYSNVSGYKINTEKSLSFLYANNEKIAKAVLRQKTETGGITLPDFRGNAFNFSPLSIMFAVGLSYIAFIMLRYVLLFLLSGEFLRKWMLNFVKGLACIY